MRQLPKYLVMSALCATVLLAACGKKADVTSSAEQVSTAAPAAEGADQAKDASDASNAKKITSSSAEQQLSSSAATASIDPNRKFIRTADARFAVKDVYQSALAIEDAVTAQGGFVTQNRIQAEALRQERYAKGDGLVINIQEYQVTGQLTVRVPSNKAQDLLRAIANQIEFLDARNFEARDAQFEILRQQVISDTARRRSERGESRVSEKELADQVAFATITLNVYQGSKIRKTETPDLDAVLRENRPSFFPRLGHAMAAGWHGVLEVILWLATVWPLWLGIAASVWVFRILKRHRPE